MMDAADITDISSSSSSSAAAAAAHGGDLADDRAPPPVNPPNPPPRPPPNSDTLDRSIPSTTTTAAAAAATARTAKSSSPSGAGIHDRHLSVNVIKAARYEADSSSTPSTAVPPLGASSSSFASAPTSSSTTTTSSPPPFVSSSSSSSSLLTSPSAATWHHYQGPITPTATAIPSSSDRADSQQQPQEHRDEHQSQGHHRRGAASHDLVPRQTLIKALASSASASASASVSRSKKPEALSLGGMLFPHPSSSSPSAAAASPQQLADALQDLAKRRSAPPTAISNMLSPCFYHQRFDDAVDIDKVLDEIKNDESMSHSRLVQTATSVREVSKQLQRRPVKRAVRNVMIVTKARDNQLVYLTRELASWLLHTPRYGSDVGVNVYVDAKLRNSKRFDAAAIVARDTRFEHMLKYWTPDLCWSQPERFDLVLTLGGDGTVLFTSWLFQRIVPPVLSFSLGSLGFMTTFEFEHYKRHLDRVMGDDGMKINLRMRFTCTVWRDGSSRGSSQGSSQGCSSRPMEMEEGEQFEVLNELVIDRGPSPYVSNLELYGDDELLTVVQADGCIFSTPTGSTAYSLSAGGSLVHPDIPAILLTPICPHTLSFRPMVLSDTMALRVAVPRTSRATAHCAFDGKGRIELRQGDHVTITASQYPFPTVTRTDTEWFDSVSRTLRWNVRAAAQKPFDASGMLRGGPSSSSSQAGGGSGGGGGGDDNAHGDDYADDDTSWDIDTDSAYYASEEGSAATSPVRRQMSMLGL